MHTGEEPMSMRLFHANEDVYEIFSDTTWKNGTPTTVHTPSIYVTVACCVLHSSEMSSVAVVLQSSSCYLNDRYAPRVPVMIL